MTTRAVILDDVEVVLSKCLTASTVRSFARAHASSDQFLKKLV
jgi:hypothetical protein